MVSKSVFMLLSYGLGSIPFGLLYGLWIEHTDPREEGSGNIGATNVLRNFGWIAGVFVLILDVAKGAVPVYASIIAFPSSPWFQVSVGGACVVGHIFSVFLGFDGGKGVATSAGVLGVLMPWALLLSLAVFMVVVGVTRYMSAGSLTGALVLPLAGSYFEGATAPMVLGAWLLAALIYWQHRKNIGRLLRGEENRFLR